MTIKEAWDIFCQTGNIIDYLVYTRIKMYDLIKSNN